MGRNGSGVTPATESSIQISFNFQGQQCRERLALKPTPSNLKRAAQHRAAILDAIARGTFDYATTFPDSPRRFKFTKGGGLSLKDYLETWIDSKRKQIKSSTLIGYTKIVTHFLIPQLGHHVLAELRRAHVKEVLTGMEVTNKRLANIQSVLRSALQDAVTDDILETNPLYGWCYANREILKEHDDVDPFTEREQADILNACEGQVRNLVQFALWSGMRTSELIGLNWGDVDWQRGVVKVTRVKTQRATEFEVTKTKAGQRSVKLLGPALEALLDQKAHTYLKGEEIFQDPRYGERWAGDQPIREGFWGKLLQRAKVRYRRPYQTRHTYASMMLSAGESPMWVAAQMGHASWQMIGKVYGRWIPDAAPQAGEKAVQTFGRVG